MQIFISSCSVKYDSIIDTINFLCKKGYKNIELTGGNKYEEKLIEKIKKIKEKFSLEFILHNYFPVPKEDFVINLCSTNDHIFNKSIEFCLNSIKISKSFKIKKYAVHAGFFFDFPSSQAGNKKKFKLIDSKLVCLDNFYKAWSILKDACSNELDLYIENNVFSIKDSQSFNGDKPYMLLDFSDFNEIKSKINFHLLLDVAHLYVTSNTLGKSFKKELDNYISYADYIHYSENNKIEDLNKGSDYRTDIFSSLSQYDLSKKTITLEIYGNLDSLIYSYNKFLSL